MREIKFRVWSPEYREMFYRPELYAIFYSATLPPREKDVSCKLTDGGFHDDYDYGDDGGGAILMQYTGLKDKNGKEIYEGDIVKGDWGGEEIFKVHWAQDGWRAEGKKRLRGWGDHPAKWVDHWIGSIACGLANHEIIGNIYENPELLEPAS